MIRTFMDVFVGSYKDGTEGGRDYISSHCSTVFDWTDHVGCQLEH